MLYYCEANGSNNEETKAIYQAFIQTTAEHGMRYLGWGRIGSIWEESMGFMEENKIWAEYSDRPVDVISLTYPQLDMFDHFLTYDWIERAEEVGEQEAL